MTEFSQDMKNLLELFKSVDYGLEVAPKGKVYETQRLNKQRLLERYKGANEKLAGKIARNQTKIHDLIAELSRERDLNNPDFFYMLTFHSFLQLTTIFKYQLKLLELQSKIQK